MSGSAPVVAFFCATYLKPEMHHIHRQILAVNGWTPFVIAQKIENLESFPMEDLAVIPRSPFRFLARGMERYGSHVPWQISDRETRRICAELKRCEARVLHVFFGNVAVHLLPLIRHAPVPLVVSFHGADVTGAIATGGYRAAREEIFARVKLVACRSAAMIDSVVALGCPREKIRVVPTTLPAIEFRERTLPADGSLRLVQASRLIPKKGLATSIRAFAQLAKDFPKMTFVIAGSGPLEPELRALADQLDVSGRVHFAGFLPQAALRDLYASSHVFVHPSESVAQDVEGVPNALLEAMASGLPVVATRHGGIPEAVRDGEEGLLVSEGDAPAVAEAIRRLCMDADFYATIAKAGAAGTNARFSGDKVGEILRSLYDEAASG